MSFSYIKNVLLLWFTCIFFIAPATAQNRSDATLMAVADTLSYLQGEAEACQRAQSRMIVDCTQVKSVIALLGRLEEGLLDLETYLGSERDRQLAHASTYLENFQNNLTQQGKTADALFVQDNLTLAFKVLTLSTQAVALTRRLGLNPEQPASQWKLNEQLSLQEQIGPFIARAGSLANDAATIKTLATKPGSASQKSIYDLGAAFDIADVIYNASDLFKAVQREGLANILKKPAGQVAILALIDKVGDYAIQHDRSARSTQLQQLNQALASEHQAANLALDRAAAANLQIVEAQAQRARISSIVQQVQRCQQQLCTPPHGNANIPAGAAIKSLPDAENSVRQRLNALSNVAGAIRSARWQATAGLCTQQIDPIPSQTDVQIRTIARDIATLVSAHENAESEYKRMEREYRQGTGVDAGTYAREFPNLVRRYRSLTRELAEKRRRHEELTVGRARDATATWNGSWQTVWGTVAISQDGASTKLTPVSGTFFARNRGRYIVTQSTPKSISGEWTIQPFGRRGGFHWCLDTNKTKFQYWRSEFEKHSWTELKQGFR